MGQYLNPPDRVKEIGRKLEVPALASYSVAAAQLAENEDLYMLAQRLDAPFKNCVHLYSESEFSEFSRQIQRGNILFQGFFAVDNRVTYSQYQQNRVA